MRSAPIERAPGQAADGTAFDQRMSGYGPAGGFMPGGYGWGPPVMSPFHHYPGPGAPLYMPAVQFYQQPQPQQQQPGPPFSGPGTMQPVMQQLPRVAAPPPLPGQAPSTASGTSGGARSVASTGSAATTEQATCQPPHGGSCRPGQSSGAGQQQRAMSSPKSGVSMQTGESVSDDGGEAPAADDCKSGADKSADGEEGGRIPCAFFLKTGTCAYGDRCKFEHPLDKMPLVRFNVFGLPLRPGEPDCAFYVKNWRCAFGPSCKFNHPDPYGVPWGMPPGTAQMQAQAAAMMGAAGMHYWGMQYITPGGDQAGTRMQPQAVQGHQGAAVASVAAEMAEATARAKAAAAAAQQGGAAGLGQAVHGRHAGNLAVPIPVAGPAVPTTAPEPPGSRRNGSSSPSCNSVDSSSNALEAVQQQLQVQASHPGRPRGRRNSRGGKDRARGSNSAQAVHGNGASPMDDVAASGAAPPRGRRPGFGQQQLLPPVQHDGSLPVSDF